MKLHRLEICNLKSLKGKYILDFDAMFGASQLFLIHGPTGAGKTSIFDAVSLALYGRTPKLRGTSRGIGREDIGLVMNAECAWAMVDLHFSLLDGDQQRHHFRARWEQRRARSRVDGRLQDPARSLERLDPTTLESVEILCSGSLRKETGPAFKQVLQDLDFDDFCRTVLLAQGDFATFVRAEPSQRARLLERITRLERYAHISRYISDQSKTASRAVEKLAQRLAHLPRPETEGVIRQARDDAQQSCLELESLLQIALQLRQQGDPYANIKTIESTHALKIAALEEQQTERKKRTVRLKEIEANIEEVKEARRLFEARRAELHPLLRTLASRRDEVLTLSAEARALENQIRELVQALEAMGPAPTTADPSQALRGCSDRRDAAEQTLRGVLGRSGGDLQAACEAALRQHARTGKTLANLRHGLQQRHQLETEQARLKGIQEQLARERHSALGQQGQLEREAQEISRDLEVYRVALQPQKLREQLIRGGPCPVCGSTDHPLAGLSDERAEEWRTGMTQKTLRKKNVERKLRALRAQLATSAGRSTETEQNLARLGLRQRRIQDHIADQQRSLTARSANPIPRDIAAVNALDAECQAEIQRISTHRASLRQAESALRSALERERRERERQLKQATKADLERRLVARRDDSARANEAYAQGVRELCDSLGLSADLPVQAAHEAAVLELRDERAKLESTRDLNLGLRTDTLEQIASDDVKIARLIDQIAEQQRMLVTTRQAARDQQRDLDTRIHELDPQRIELFEPTMDLAQRKARLLAQEEALSQQLVNHRGQRQEQQKKLDALEQNRDLFEAQQQAQRQWRRWRRLHELINPRRPRQDLREFALSLELDRLIRMANEQLQQIAPEFRLLPRFSTREGEEGMLLLDFEIERDGQTRRPLITLSGGETFLVSLAFAVGLSNLLRGKLRIETLLIDEGFGSLDRNNAEIAIAGLEQLTRVDVQVGLISHVETLRDRISAQTTVDTLQLSPEAPPPRRKRQKA